jgi:hypothetical protein
MIYPSNDVAMHVNTNGRIDLLVDEEVPHCKRRKVVGKVDSIHERNETRKTQFVEQTLTLHDFHQSVKSNS